MYRVPCSTIMLKALRLSTFGAIVDAILVDKTVIVKSDLLQINTAASKIRIGS